MPPTAPVEQGGEKTRGQRYMVLLTAKDNQETFGNHKNEILISAV